jgi:cytochrome c oxidase subunit 3
VNIFRTLMEKPWLAQPAGAEGLEPEEQHSLPAGRIALRFFLAVVSLIFFLFIVTFLSRSNYPDFQALAGQPWQPLSDPWRLWLNTGVLFLSSVAMQWAVFSSRKLRFNMTAAAIALGAFFAVLFLLGQLWVWQDLMALGYYVASNPANSYFYLFTTMHGLHLLGGLVALGIVTWRLWQGASPERTTAGMELCATYWHFLLLVWLLLFALLASSPETYETLAELCGLLR